MVFASLVFLYVFLPLNLLFYYAWDNARYRHGLQIVFSLVFYAWGEPIWVSLLLFTSAFDYSIGRLIDGYRSFAKLFVAASLTMNLGLLGVFKYSGLLVTTANSAFGTHFHSPGYSLPIGISFYTFQTISYVIDVYRRDVPAQRSYVKFLFFVSLFHQLVAGPIVRYAHIMREIDLREHRVSDFSRGVTRLCVGLFKKVVVANVAGELVKRYLDGELSSLSVAEAWFGLCMYTLQIYFDFSGYSDMAIGLGNMFGFHYHENFQHPYVARSVTDFWRRWHISLSTFFRDYVYIPLGGKNHLPYRNLFIVWALTGLWHGASWNFVCWGLYYGVFIALERLALARVLDRLPALFRHVYLVAVVVVGWALFYFTDFARLRAFLRVLFGLAHTALVGPDFVDVVAKHALWLAAAVLMCAPVVPALRRRLFRDDPLPRWVHVALAFMNIGIVFVATSMLVGKSYNPFLYFRF